MTQAVRATTPAFPAGALDRRFYALVIDLGLSSAVLVSAGLLARAWDGWWLRALVVGGTAAGLVGLLAALVGLRGTTPGKAATGLRIVDAASGRPVGVGRALVRTALVALAAVPTFGLGLVTLAWTALVDPSHARRGWHDRVAGSVVLDVRPAPTPPAPPDQGPRPIVNLTAARLVPTAVPEPHPVLPAVGERGGRPDAAPSRWRVTFDSGESLVVEGPTLLGRGPGPRPEERVHAVLPLRSRDMSMSKTHAQVDVHDGVLVVVDRGSTNGSVLIRQGVPRELAAGRPATLLDGDRVRFGDREMTVAREA